MSNDNTERPSLYYPKFFERLPSMEGKTVVITGCSRGLGYVTASAVAQKGGFVIMLNRASERSKEAHSKVTASATGPILPQTIDCDLLDFQSVRKACRDVCTITAKNGIDVLCCNAGVMLQPDELSVDGFDITASTNVLSHFLIVKELLPELEKASSRRNDDGSGDEEKERNGARIVTMSSASAYGPPAFDPSFFSRRDRTATSVTGNRDGENSVQSSYARYHQSKLANLVFTSTLHERLRSKGSSISALACTPGVCGTDMYLHATKMMMGTPSPLDKVPSVEDGAMAQLKCVCDPAVHSGELWGPGFGERAAGTLVRTEMTPEGGVLVDEEAKDGLWRICEEAVGKFEI